MAAREIGAPVRCTKAANKVLEATMRRVRGTVSTSKLAVDAGWTV